MYLEVFFMGAKRLICTIFYVLFTLLFSALLVCNITGFINQFNIMPNDFFTTTLNNNLLNPVHTAFDSFGIMDSTLLYSILNIVYLAITLVFWFLSVSNLVNVIRNTPTRGPSITTIIFSVVLFLIMDVVVVLLVYGGLAISEVVQNYYLVFLVAIWLLTLIVAVVAINIKAGVDKLENADGGQSDEENSALARERRVQQILNDEVDPRV